MKSKPMTQLIDALSARTRFGELMQKAEKNNLRFLVSRRGKPAVVILSVDDYLRNILKKPKILAEIQQEAVAADLDKMTEDEIQEVISEARQAPSKK
jgi:prevent-host-death family protein